MLPPEILVVHLGNTSAQRLRCKARLFKDRYIPDPPTPVSSLADLRLPNGGVTVISAPMGLAEPYAELAKIETFREGLDQFGKPGRFQRFYEICDTSSQVAIERPFFPKIATNVSREPQMKAMGDAAFALRRCELKVGETPMFWLGSGKSQPGRQAVTAWQQLLSPRLANISLWPFDGTMPDLLAAGKPVVAELNPGLIQHRLGLDVLIQFSRMPRASCGMQIYEQVKGVDFQNVRKTLLFGQGPSPEGDGEFDTLVSLIGVAHLFLENKVDEPHDVFRKAEGWMLGL